MPVPDPHQLLQQLPEGFALHELVRDTCGRAVDYRFLEINPAFTELTGLAPEAVLGGTVREFLPDIEAWLITTYARVVESGEPTQFVYQSRALGRFYDVVAYRAGPERFATVFSDITVRVRQARQSALSLRLLKRLDPALQLEAQAEEVVRLLAEGLGLGRVSLRLREGADYPLVASFGGERPLPCGRLIEPNQPHLSCLCGCVLEGREIQGLGTYTPRGSFLLQADETPPLAPRLPDTRTWRGLCLGRSESAVALIPLKRAGEVIGLLHFSDASAHALDSEVLVFFEEIATALVERLHRRSRTAHTDDAAILVQALRETVRVLEQTREHFKSKDLGRLRKQLAQLVLASGAAQNPAPTQAQRTREKGEA